MSGEGSRRSSRVGRGAANLLLACGHAAHIDPPATQAWWQVRRVSEKGSPISVDPFENTGSGPATMAIDLGGRGAVALNDVD